MVRITEIIKRDVFLHVITVYSGSFLNAAALFLSNIFIARSLSIEAMGGFTIALLTLGAVTEMSDIGLNAGLTRFVPAFEKEPSSGKLQWLFCTVKRFRVIFSVVITMLGLIFSPAIATYVYGRPEVTDMLRLSFFGVGGVIILGFVITYFQASQRFILSSSFNAIKGISRLAFVSIFFFFGTPSLSIFLIGFITLPWILAFIAYKFIPISLRQGNIALPPEEQKQLRAQLFRFSSFMTLWSVIAIIASRVDQVMISRLMTLRDVALYGVAMQCTLVFSLLSQAIATVLAPRMNRFETTDMLRSSLRKTLSILVPILFFLACVLYPTKWLVPVFFGEEYRSAMGIYVWLMYSVLLGMVGIPFSIILSYFHKTNIIAYGALIQLVLTIVCNTFLISTYGLIGAGITFALVVLFSQLYTIICAMYYLKKKEPTLL